MAYVIQSLQASPEFKGIKTNLNNYLEIVELQASPEFKGIKTTTTFMCWKGSKLQASPEFKGIKTTVRQYHRQAKTSFKPALNSKGLRLKENHHTRWQARFKPALNSKGLRLTLSDTLQG